MSLFRRFQTARPGSHLHSSGMVGNSSKIGATSAESFAQRQQIGKNRQFVSAYQDAGVLHTYQKSAQESPRTSRVDTPGTRPSSAVPPRGGFTEPQTRRYNPYG